MNAPIDPLPACAALAHTLYEEIHDDARSRLLLSTWLEQLRVAILTRRQAEIIASVRTLHTAAKAAADALWSVHAGNIDVKPRVSRLRRIASIASEIVMRFDVN